MIFKYGLSRRDRMRESAKAAIRAIIVVKTVEPPAIIVDEIIELRPSIVVFQSDPKTT